MLIIAIEELVLNRLVLFILWPDSLELNAFAHLFNLAQLGREDEIWFLRLLRLSADLVLIVLVTLVEMLLYRKFFLLLATALRLLLFIVTSDALVQIVDLKKFLERLSLKHISVATLVDDTPAVHHDYMVCSLEEVDRVRD